MRFSKVSPRVAHHEMWVLKCHVRVARWEHEISEGGPLPAPAPWVCDAALEALAVSTKTAGYDTNRDTNAQSVSVRPV